MRLFSAFIIILITIAAISCAANQADRSGDRGPASPDISSSGWALSFGGSDADDVAGVRVDNDGFIYVTGTFSGDCDFDPDRTLVPDTVSANSREAYLACYDSDGVFQWISQWGGDMGMKGGGTTVDPDGNFLITGSFFGTADLIPGLGEDYRGTENMYGATTSSYVIQLDAGGGYQWAANWEADSCSTVFTDHSGNAYLLGELAFGMSADLDPGPDRNNHGSAGGTDIYMIKLNAEGEYQWSWSLGGSGNELGSAIAVSDDGSVYITGCYGSASILTSGGLPVPGYPVGSPYPGIKNTLVSYGVAYYLHEAGTSSTPSYYYGNTEDENEYDNLSVSGLSDIFLMKITPDGELEWTASFGGAGHDIGQDLIFRDGKLYLTGSLTEGGPGRLETELLLGRDDTKAFLMCIDPDGDEIWTETWGEDSVSLGENSGNALWLDEDGYILVTGQLITEREEERPLYLSHPGYAGPDGSNDMFLRKYTVEGSLVWEKTWDTSATSGSAVGTSIVVDRIGNIIIGGEFRGVVDFNPGADISERTSNGSADAFLLKLKSDGTW